MLMAITLLTTGQPVFSAASVHTQEARKTVSAASEASPGTQTASSGESGKGSTAEDRMLNDLANYIYQCETMYRDLLWVLDHFERFDENKTWENLQFARASLAITRLHISNYRLPEFQTSREDQSELMRRGIDVSLIETLEDAFKDEQTTMNNTCINLQDGIMDDVFLKDQWELCMQHAAVLRELTACDIQYLANTADWVLASLNDDERTAEFCGLMDRYCPMTRACQASVLKSPEKIEEETTVLLDQIEKLLLDRTRIIGARKNRRNELKELLEKEDYAAIGANLMEISDLPLTLSYPLWYENEEIYYYWKEDGKVVKAPDPGTALERVPDGVKITIAGVTKDELLEYQAELEDIGLTSHGSTEEDGKLNILYQYDGSKFTFIWEENIFTILMTEKPFCFVPEWYFPAQKAVE